MSYKVEIKRNPPGSGFERFLKTLWYHFVCAGGDFGKNVLIGNFIKPHKLSCKELKKRTNETVVITGGSRGIGLELVKKFLELDYTIIMGVRNLTTSQKEIDDFRKMGVSTGYVKLLHLDLKSLNSVRRFAAQVLASEEGSKIDLLVNNGGIFQLDYELTEDDFESHFQVNYLSHFLLTNLLLPRIKATSEGKAKPCQIVNTSSSLHRYVKIAFDDLEDTKVYSPAKRYMDSKLCQVMHAKSLQNFFIENQYNIRALAIHPGEIATELVLNAGWLSLLVSPILKRACWTTEEAADALLNPIVNTDEHEDGGNYYECGQVASSNAQANDNEVRKQLWNRSLKMSGGQNGKTDFSTGWMMME